MNNTDQQGKQSSTDAQTLRQKAEKKHSARESKPPSPFSDADMLKLVHELEVHQIELEMQNDELTQLKKIAEESSERYTELYDFAPSGYVTISRDCKIQYLNLACADMIGKTRLELINRSLVFFMTEETRPVFLAFIQKAYMTRTKETCGVTLLSKENTPVYALFPGRVMSARLQWWILLTLR